MNIHKIFVEVFSFIIMVMVIVCVAVILALFLFTIIEAVVRFIDFLGFLHDH